ncbi:alanine racemase [Anaerobacterium chartisolvens]|uniref:Alanine racemase n=1 Tax=Anaerobacterium chartisolvens TaxID=1297424 RepID=A0A369B7R8_9FIRM|nr:alanine racemase [Anaerobacterium chartisolvens]RCX17471.1 alanine racemase [Anaerobacterium chartisolvens]
MKTLIIERDKLVENIQCIKERTSSTVIAVLKGNGYGLGIVDFARLLTENGIDFFAVSELSEAMVLRENGFTNKILLLASTSLPQEAELIVSNNIIATVGSVNSSVTINEAAKKLGVTAEVHLKIDTGFGRFGFLPGQIDNYYSLLKSFDNMKIAGTYSHLSFSFAKKTKLVQNQFDLFIKCAEGLKQNGIDTGILHICNSCAFLKYESMHLDAVRVGSAFLGRIPIENKYGLSRIGVLKSQIIEFKDLPSNSYIGYANTCKTKRNTRIGIVPVGYKDGFGVEKIRDTFRLRDILRYVYNDLKQWKKRMYVRVNGKRARILGRISMYNIIIDLTGIDAEIGDEVLLDINPIFTESSVKREML